MGKNIIEKIEKEANLAAKLINYEIKYIPHVEFEECDEFIVSFEPLGILVYGESKESALESAINTATGKLMSDTEMRRAILLEALEKRKKKLKKR